MEAKTSLGISTWQGMELRDKDGRIVYAENTDTRAKHSRLWEAYDKWRCEWCTRHRKAWTPRGLRDGTRRHLWFALFHLFRR